MEIKLNSEKAAYITTVNTFHPRYVRKIAKSKAKDPIYYIQQPAFLDTETSHNHDPEDPIGWIYQWCMEFNGEYCIGRKPSELITQLKLLHDHYELCEKKRLVIFIHNASYDHTYLYKYLRQAFGDPKILAVKAHKILTALYDGIEIRCSYLLSNMSLAKWGEHTAAKVRKMAGAIDYDVIRFQDTELDIDTDWAYMVNDVASMKAALYNDMIGEDDNIATIPLTSTGYVRRDCRNASRKEEGFRKWFKDTRLDYDSYLAAIWGYSGGLTHGNRFFAGKTLSMDKKRADIWLKYPGKHGDMKSFYPTEEMISYTAIGKMYFEFDIEESGHDYPMDKFKEMLNTRCCLMQVAFSNLRLKKGVTCPCISKSKIYNLSAVRCTNDLGVNGTDNGRVINAEGVVILWLTELDYQWVIDQYETDGFKLLKLFSAERGYDRECIRNTTDKFFQIKETAPKGYFRGKSKNKLNAIYGMKSTNPVRQEVELDLDNGSWSEFRDMSPEHITEALDKYYSNYNSFNSFIQGVYITSWARYWILYLIKKIGYESFIYCDTDSIYYIDSPEAQKAVNEFNEMILKKNKELGLGVKNKEGTISYYGTFESEEDFKEFRFLHAKCYAWTGLDDELHCTIAGVTADNRYPEDDPRYMTREQELGDINNLQDGMTFKECGGTNSLYVDREPEIININGHITEVASACIIRNTTKTLGGTVEGFNIYEVNV